MKLRAEPREVLAFVVSVLWTAALVLIDWKLQTSSFLRDGLSGVLVGTLCLLAPPSIRDRFGLRRLWPPLLMALAMLCGLAVGNLAFRIARGMTPPAEFR